MEDSPEKTTKQNRSVQPIYLLMEKRLLEEIEDYRFAHRFRTRIDTIKALLRIGLDSDKKK